MQTLSLVSFISNIIIDSIVYILMKIIYGEFTWLKFNKFIHYIVLLATNPLIRSQESCYKTLSSYFISNYITFRL